LPAKESVIFAEVEGNTIIEDVPAKLKHFSAQVAMVPQPSMAFSHGLVLWGQQSDMSSVMDMSAGSGDLELTPAPPAAGSIATDRATRSARIVRLMPMDEVNSSFFGPAVK
jgi:hypothetical protein